MHDWLPAFVVALADKQVLFKKLGMQMNDAQKTQNATFVLISINIRWQTKWNTLPVCQEFVMLYFLLMYAPECNYTFKITKNEIEIWFLISSPGKCFLSGFSQYGHVSRIITEGFLQLLNYPCASLKTITSFGYRVRENLMVPERSLG